MDADPRYSNGGDLKTPTAWRCLRGGGGVYNDSITMDSHLVLFFQTMCRELGRVCGNSSCQASGRNGTPVLLELELTKHLSVPHMSRHNGPRVDLNLGKENIGRSPETRPLVLTSHHGSVRMPRKTRSRLEAAPETTRVARGCRATSRAAAVA